MEKRQEILGMTELDKFKRRMIRSVAGMLIHQKMSEEGVFNELQKVMGCDCKVLWDRMKSLTVKKLNRLLAADDRTEMIPVVARMTLTDWQLYDQILVHEDVDVIGVENMTPNKADSRVLIDLFDLVQRFDIEIKVGYTLTEAWTDATLYYNSKGHQCSPMLLQKRWYQLKAETRRRFYYFWNNYRGNKTLMPNAEPYRPTILQRAVAKRFPEVITQKFPDWDTCIKDGLVALPNEFQKIKWNKGGKKVSNENTPDIVVIETPIETIDLLHESDTEQESNPVKDADANKEEDSITRVKIKKEPIDPIPDYQPVAKEKTSKTSEVIAKIQEEECLFDNINADIDSLKAAEKSMIHFAIGYESKLKETKNQIGANDNQVDSSGSIPKITNVFGNAPLTNETLSIIENFAKQTATITQETDTPKTTEDINATIKADNTRPSNPCVDTVDCDIEPDVKIEQRSLSNIPIKTENTDKTSCTEDIKPIISQEVSVASDENKSNVSSTSRLNLGTMDLSTFGEIPDNLNFADDGIEIADNSVEFVSEKQDNEEKDESDKNVQVNTEKVDNGSSQASDNESESGEFKLDEKLFLDPVVYTQKLNDMSILRNKDFNVIDVKTLINKIIEESKPISERSVGAKEAKIDRQRVSLSSNMFQKPKHRKYNPIQLCKNPDFNTRLKRITAGFLTLAQNRAHLKKCMPVTIDLTKAFESKLINNTIYLKKPDNSGVIEIDEDEGETVSIMPSKNAIQSIINNTVTLSSTIPNSSNELLIEPTTSRNEDVILGRNRIIHLPDIVQIRRTNQNLLTAEISPMQIHNTSDMRRSPDLHDRACPLQNDVFFDNNACFNINSKNVHGFVNNLYYNRNNENSVSIINSEVTQKDVIDITDDGNQSRLLELVQTKSSFCNDNVEVNKSNVDNGTAPIETQPKKVPKSRVAWRPAYPQKLNEGLWSKKIKVTDSHIDEFLITDDTLVKMLCLFNGEQPEESHKKKGNKKPIGTPNTRTPVDQNTNESKNEEDNVKDTLKGNKDATEAKDVPSLTPIAKKKSAGPKKPRKKSMEAKAESGPSRFVTRIVTNSKSLYCCWARDQIVMRLNNSRRRGSRHGCEYKNCKCCCAKDLQEYVLNTTKQNKLYLDVLKGLPKDTNEAEVQTVDVESQMKVVNSISNTVTQNDVPEIAEENYGNISVRLPDPTEDKNLEENIEEEVIMDTESAEVPSPDSEEVAPSDMNVVETVVTDNTLKQLSPLEGIPTISDVYSLNPTPDQQPLVNSLHNLSRKSLSIIVGPSNKTPHNLVSTNKTNVQIIPNVLPISHNNIQTSPLKIDCIQNTDPNTLSANVPPSIHPSANGVPNVPQLTIKLANDKIIKYPVGLRYQGKLLFMNSENIAKVACPIYLGPNKILLTNIKIPQGKKRRNHSLLKNQQKPAVVITLPKGTDWVLYNEERVKYFPRAESDALPIFQAQQNLISHRANLSTSNPTITDEVVVLSDEETSCSNDASPAAPCSVSNNMEIDNITKNATLEKYIEINNKIQPTENESTSKIIDSSISDHTEKIIEKNTEENVHTAKQNSSFKDHENEGTIEMAGSSLLSLDRKTDDFETSASINTSMNDDESTLDSSTSKVDVYVENAPVNATETLASDAESTSSSKKTILLDLMEMSGISTEDAAAIQVEQKTGETSTVPPMITSQNENPVPPLYELSIVTTVAEMKYASAQNGLFFKLDCATGEAVQINVYIKSKYPEPTPFKQGRIAPKVTIDLTDEGDNNPNDTSNPNEMYPKGLVAPISDTIKFDTVFGTKKRPRILKSLTSCKKRNNFMTYEVQMPRQEQRSLLRHKRKSELVAQVLDESSDEEPLSVKAKRQRMTATNNFTNNDIQVSENTETDCVVSEEDGNAVHCITSQANTPIGPAMEGEDDPMKYKTPVFEYEQNPNEDNEDCILGV